MNIGISLSLLIFGLTTMLLGMSKTFVIVEQAGANRVWPPIAILFWFAVGLIGFFPMAFGVIGVMNHTEKEDNA